MPKTRQKKPRRTARNRQPTSPERIDVDKRRKEMLDMRVRGMSLRAIAAELGMHHSSVSEAIEAELAELTREPAERLRTVELERLDEMFEGLWTKAKSGDGFAIGNALRIMERRAKLLGLDAPVKNTHAGEAGAAPIALTVSSAEAELAKAMEIHRARLEAEPAYRKKVRGE